MLIVFRQASQSGKTNPTSDILYALSRKSDLGLQQKNKPSAQELRSGDNPIF